MHSQNDSLFVNFSYLRKKFKISIALKYNNYRTFQKAIVYYIVVLLLIIRETDYDTE
jgi:hypothetical protein